MKKIFCLFLLFLQFASGNQFQDIERGSYVFEWDHAEDFEAARELFLTSFLHAYNPIPYNTLNVENKREFLEESIDEELELVFEFSDTIHWLIAKIENKVVGLIIVDLSDYPNEVYIRQMAVHPDIMRCYLGSEMAKVVGDNFSEVKRVVAITRRFNIASINFLQSLGFKESIYMNEAYDPNRYRGFELIR